MDTSAPCLTVSERIRLFFDLLRDQPALFQKGSDAHAHIQQCLWEIEDSYTSGLPMTSRMTINSFERFHRCKDSAVRYCLTAKHTVLIHENGAYGIYNTQPFKDLGGVWIFNLEPYKTLVPLVLFSNSKGEKMW